MMYSCRPCNYFLHASCAEMPLSITHPYDPKEGHSLILRVYGEASCSYCDACGKQGKGFGYHCRVCQIDLHGRCASTPMSWIHQSHPHKLKLLFSPTHHDKKFNCDVFHEKGSSQWLYRCDSCDFDVHMDCKNAPIVNAFPNQTDRFGSSSRSAHHGPPPPQPAHWCFGQQVPNYQYQNQSYPTPGIPVNTSYDPAAIMAILQRLHDQKIMNQQQIQALMAAQRPGRAGGGLLERMAVSGLFQAVSGNFPGLDMSSFQGL